jgi:hypothetical protein
MVLGCCVVSLCCMLVMLRCFPVCVMCHRSFGETSSLAPERPYSGFMQENIFTLLRFRADFACATSRSIICRVDWCSNAWIMAAFCCLRPFIVLCPSYPQLVVLFPLILTRNAAKVITVISVRRVLPNLRPKEVAFA